VYNKISKPPLFLIEGAFILLGGVKMVRIENQENQTTAYIAGEIDHHSARLIREEIDTNVERVQPSLLRLDFKDVT